MEPIRGFLLPGPLGKSFPTKLLSLRWLHCEQVDFVRLCFGGVCTLRLMFPCWWISSVLSRWIAISWERSLRIWVKHLMLVLTFSKKKEKPHGLKAICSCQLWGSARRLCKKAVFRWAVGWPIHPVLCNYAFNYALYWWVYVCVYTGVAAEWHLSSSGVHVRQPEVPVFIDTHGSCIHIPARVAYKQVLKAWQHLRHSKQTVFWWEICVHRITWWQQ